MAEAKVIYIGHTKARRAHFIAALRKRYDVCVVSSGQAALTVIPQWHPHIIVLDSISMRTSGERLCRKVYDAFPHLPLIHMHTGPRRHTESPAEVQLIPAFTPRKLVNSIERLMQAKDDATLTCGPFAMNLVRRILTINGHEFPLTPKQALLIETFLRHPGKTVNRKTLMETIWDTDYMGDTRTLDVHIRWVRKAMEKGGLPGYLKTIRGVGYRLDVPDLNGH